MGGEVRRLREEIEETAFLLTDAENRDPDKERAARAAAAAAVTEDKWFICSGCGQDTPAFLQGSGKVRNRQMAKNVLEALLEEFWDTKARNDARPAGASSPYIPENAIRNCTSCGFVARFA